MWRIIALTLLVCVGCEGTQAAKQPIKLPNPDFLLESNSAFFNGNEKDGTAPVKAR